LNQFTSNDGFKVSFVTFQARNLIINFLSTFHKKTFRSGAWEIKFTTTDRGHGGNPGAGSDMITCDFKTSQGFPGRQPWEVSCQGLQLPQADQIIISTPLSRLHLRQSFYRV